MFQLKTSATLREYHYQLLKHDRETIMHMLTSTIRWLHVKYREMHINAMSYFKALYLQHCERTDKKQKLKLGQFPHRAVGTTM